MKNKVGEAVLDFLDLGVGSDFVRLVAMGSAG